MVHRNRARSSSLFLMELIIAILFFTIFSAVCVQFFVKAHLMNKDSYALNHAVSECSGVAEVIGVSDGTSEAIATLTDLHPKGEFQANPTRVNKASIDQENVDQAAAEQETRGEVGGTIYYDSDFKECSKNNAKYVLEVYLNTDGQMLEADMNVRAVDEGVESKSEIYELTTTHHIARRTR